MNDIFINGRRICKEQPPYVIAELSANHNGDLQKALDTISQAKSSGADAIKLQTYTADTMTIDSDNEDFITGSVSYLTRHLYSKETEGKETETASKVHHA